MNKPPSFKGRKHTLETKSKLAIITAERNKKLWANPSSGLRNRKNPWVVRQGEVNKLKGMTYEEIHGIEKAKQLKELRKQSGYWKYVSDEQRGINSLKAWDTPERARKTAEAQGRKPNKMEAMFAFRLEMEFPSIWKYVGDGQVCIGRGNPDFINVNGQKLLIEVYTPYYKLKAYGTVKVYIEKRYNQFAEYGFKTLFLDLFDDWDLLIEKVGQFLEMEV